MLRSCCPAERAWDPYESECFNALTANRIRPDLIVGTSVGAVNGAWLASGDTEANLAELADIWRIIKRDDVFPVSPFTGLFGLAGWSNHLVVLC